MKKLLISVVVVSLLAIASVFAYGHSIEVQASPYSFQRTEFSSSAVLESSYGWGGQTGYRFSFDNGCRVGADLSFTSYKFGDYDKYLVLSLTARGGFKGNLSDSVFYVFEGGAGADLRIGDDVKGVYPVIEAGLSLGYTINGKISILCGVDAGLTFQKSGTEGLSSTDLNVTPRLGAEINL